jgi:hypothetical protein
MVPAPLLMSCVSHPAEGGRWTRSWGETRSANASGHQFTVVHYYRNGVVKVAMRYQYPYESG